MPKFIRWRSIENYYREKFINSFLAQYPELLNEQFVITEKLHGTNFQWCFAPGERIRAGSRNRYLDAKGSFQGVPISDLVMAHEDLLAQLKNRADEKNQTIRLFGELFGQGIQKGIDYGPKKRLLYFGAMLSGTLVSFKVLESMVAPQYLVPIIEVVDGLETALGHSCEFDSRILNVPDNVCEGIVIQPYSLTYTDWAGSVFILKKKNDKFKEKESVKKIRVIDTEVAQWNREFSAYITENRLQSLFSKEGEIKTPKQISQYIKWLLTDAKEDFLKDHGKEIEHLEKRQLKQIWNVGSKIANMLKTYLKGGTKWNTV